MSFKWAQCFQFLLKSALDTGYWAVEADAETAMDGVWKKGPNVDLFEALEKVSCSLVRRFQRVVWVRGPRAQALLQACSYRSLAALLPHQMAASMLCRLPEQAAPDWRATGSAQPHAPLAQLRIPAHSHASSLGKLAVQATRPWRCWADALIMWKCTSSAIEAASA